MTDGERFIEFLAAVHDMEQTRAELSDSLSPADAAIANRERILRVLEAIDWYKNGGRKIWANTMSAKNAEFVTEVRALWNLMLSRFEPVVVWLSNMWRRA